MSIFNSHDLWIILDRIPTLCQRKNWIKIWSVQFLTRLWRRKVEIRSNCDRILVKLWSKSGRSGRNTFDRTSTKFWWRLSMHSLNKSSTGFRLQSLIEICLINISTKFWRLFLIHTIPEKFPTGFPPNVDTAIRSKSGQSNFLPDFEVQIRSNCGRNLAQVDGNSISTGCWPNFENDFQWAVGKIIRPDTDLYSQ